MFNDKEKIVYYLLKQDNRIKEVDYAIPLDFSKQLQKLDINRNFYISVYYKNGVFEVLNLLDEIIPLYNQIKLDYINNFLSFDKFIEFYNLDKKEVNYINS